MREAARQFTSRANGSSDPVTASRFARDILVQETGWRFLRERGIDLIASDSPGAFLDETPTAIMIRQLLGVISEFDKASLVAKLRGASERKKRATGKARGARASPSCGPTRSPWRASCVAGGRSRRSGQSQPNWPFAAIWPDRASRSSRQSWRGC